MLSVRCVSDFGSGYKFERVSDSVFFFRILVEVVPHSDKKKTQPLTE